MRKARMPNAKFFVYTQTQIEKKIGCCEGCCVTHKRKKVKPAYEKLEQTKNRYIYIAWNYTHAACIILKQLQ